MDKTQLLLIIFIAVAAFSLLLHAVSMLGMALGARVAQKKVMALIDDVRLHALPAIMSSRELVQDLTPKIKTITDNLTAVTTNLRVKSEEVSGLVGDVTQKAQVQASRVDGMVKGTLDQITFAAQALEHGIAVPVRQISGVLNGLRAGVESLRRSTPAAAEAEEDLFV